MSTDMNSRTVVLVGDVEPENHVPLYANSDLAERKYFCVPVTGGLAGCVSAVGDRVHVEGVKITVSMCHSANLNLFGAFFKSSFLSRTSGCDVEAAGPFERFNIGRHVGPPVSGRQLLTEREVGFLGLDPGTRVGMAKCEPDGTTKKMKKGRAYQALVSPPLMTSSTHYHDVSVYFSLKRWVKVTKFEKLGDGRPLVNFNPPLELLFSVGPNSNPNPNLSSLLEVGRLGKVRVEINCKD